MADNVLVGTTPTFATDDISSVHYPIQKICFGALNTATLVDSSNGFPVAQQGTWTVSISAAQTIAVTNAGTFAVQATCTNAGTFAVQAAQSGTWNVTNISGTVSLPTGAATAAKQPALGTAGTAASDVISVQGIASMTALKVDGSAVTQPVSIAAAVPVTDNSGSLTVDNGGTFAVQAAQSGTWTVQPGNTANTTAWKVDGSAVTQPVSGTVTANAGTGTLAVSLASVPSHAVTNAGTFAVQPGPATSGGLSISRAIDLSISNQGSTVAKASAGQVYGWTITNTNAAACYFKLYNKASAPTSSDTPVMTILVPGNTAGGGIAQNIGVGIAFGTGISYRVTTAVADNSTAAVAASEVLVNLYYA